MRTLVFAAGLGTRLKPITDNMPKALVPICGKPLLEHVLLKLKEYDFKEVVINLHHFPSLIREFVCDNDSFGMDIYFSDESDLLRETGGGIKHAATLLNDGDPFLVHNVDILSNLDLCSFYNAHIGNGDIESMPLATLLVSDRETARYFLFDTENNLVGWMNISTGQVKSPFPELRREASDDFDYVSFLEENELNKYAFAGIHVLSPIVFKLMFNYPDKFSIVDFYLDMCVRYIVKGYVSDNLKLVDVGKLNSLELAEDFINNL